VTAVRCAMVDVRFEGGTLAAIEQTPIIGADGALPLIAEVQSNRDAVTAADACSAEQERPHCGTPVRSKGAPLTTPSGESVSRRCAYGSATRSIA
jgi:hypothetical protein